MEKHSTEVLEAMFNGDIGEVVQLEGKNYVPAKVHKISRIEKNRLGCSYEDFMKHIDNPSKFFN
jgi:hypothetical protein